MHRSDYDTWAERHANIFGFTAETDLKMLDAWYEVLGCEDLADLEESTSRMARGEYPSYPRDHLKSLLAFIRLLKAERAPGDSQPDFEGDRGSCATCGGSGRVCVPNPRHIEDGQWVPKQIVPGVANYYTCAVCCRCALGKWYREHGSFRRGREEVRMMTLDEYEGLNPRWRLQVGRRKAEELDVARLTKRPGRLGEELDGLFERLQARAEGRGE